MTTIPVECVFYTDFGRMVLPPRLAQRLGLMHRRRDGSLDMRFKANRRVVSRLNKVAHRAFLRGD